MTLGFANPRVHIDMESPFEMTMKGNKFEFKVEANLESLSVISSVISEAMKQAKMDAALIHSDVRTTMIYTHCVPSRTAKDAKSPLDF